MLTDASKTPLLKKFEQRHIGLLSPHRTTVFCTQALCSQKATWSTGSWTLVCPKPSHPKRWGKSTTLDHTASYVALKSSPRVRNSVVINLLVEGGQNGIHRIQTNFILPSKWCFIEEVQGQGFTHPLVYGSLLSKQCTGGTPSSYQLPLRC